MTANPDKFAHLRALPQVLEVDLDYINKKDRSYGASWKRRGGVGAYMMLTRKTDRLEVFMEEQFKYDIFAGIEADPSGADGSVLAEVRDLRRYLALVEAEMVARGVVMAVSMPATSGAGGGNSGDALVEVQGAGEPDLYQQDLSAVGKLSDDEVQLVKDHRAGVEATRVMAADMRGRQYYRVGDPVMVNGRSGVVIPAKEGYSSDFVAVRLDDAVPQVFHHSLVSPRFTTGQYRTYKTGPDGVDQPLEVGDPVYVKGHKGQMTLKRLLVDDAKAVVDNPWGPRLLTVPITDLTYARHARPAEQQPTKNDSTEPAQGAPDPTLAGLLPSTAVLHGYKAGDKCAYLGTVVTLDGSGTLEIGGDMLGVIYKDGSVGTAPVSKLTLVERAGTPEDGGHHAAAEGDADPAAPVHYRRYLTHSEWHYHMREQIKWGSLQGSTLEALYELTSDDAVEDHYVAMLPQHVEEYAL